ncbi:MAG: aspartate carbamoyltransferase catalytic subunit [Legionella sp.]|nr:aspartate carbamoyltransferase catalytic subunit [Legionella sp.]
MDHFIEISQLSTHQIERLIERGFAFKQQKNYPAYPSDTVAQLFYENSTRTRVSFELAARHLSMPVINLDLQGSSETKGEVIEDTLHTLVAMGIKYFVIRHKQNGLQQRLVDVLGSGIHIINAGDGTHAHPSQALLDIMTIIEKKPKLDELKIAILGNIKHSRVANSFQTICSKLHVGQLSFICPEIWQPETVSYGQVTNNLQDGLADADVVICLRVQHERLADNEQLDLATYRNNFALTKKSLAFARPDALVMHPGPINRGIEIDSEIADGPQSLILNQVTNGVYARMAIFDGLISDLE